MIQSSTSTTTKITYGETFSFAQYAVLEGYEFAEWYTTNGAHTLITPSDTWTIVSDTVLKIE